MSTSPEMNEANLRELPTRRIVQDSLEFLPAALIASMVGVRETEQVHQWAAGILTPTPGTMDRLCFMLAQALAIAAEESNAVATSWLTSANTHLDNALPIAAIRASRFREVSGAVVVFLHGYAN